MPILDLEGAAPLFPKAKASGKRTLGPIPGLVSGGGNGGFAAAKRTRLTLDVHGSSRSADQDLYGDNQRLRAIARNAALNLGFVRKFLQMCPQNIIGTTGTLVESAVTGLNGKETAQTKRINERIDEEWDIWIKNCSADGRFSLRSLETMSIRNAAREGENLVKFVLGRKFNATGIALQPLDNDQLDDSLMQQLADNAEIRMGVEVDQYRRPLAYHLWAGHPFDLMGNRNREHKRIPASEIVHTAVWERPGQTRGYTWLAAALSTLNMYGGYKDAVLVAARSSAAQFATIESDVAEGSFGSDDEDAEGNGTNADGTQINNVEAGEFLRLEPGERLNYTSPEFPTKTHKEFTQTMLREIASSLLVQYHSLANDLEGVNFSSIRAGMVDERDMWRMLQRWWHEAFIAPIRLRWLQTALLTTLSDITLTPAQLLQYTAHGRGWDWVDPLKDAQAVDLKRGIGLTNLQIECAKLGLNWRKVLQQIKTENEAAADLGVVIGVDLQGDQGGKGVAAGDEKEAAEVGGSEASGAKGKAGGK